MRRYRKTRRGGAARRPQNEQNGNQVGKTMEPDGGWAKAKAKYDAGLALWPRDVAALLGYSRATVSAWCNRSRHALPKVGGKILPSHLDQWLDQEAARQSGGGGADDAQ